ncbi:MAG: hypothetical protein ABEJ95_01180 [Candidatus Nanohalobium sp.]
MEEEEHFKNFLNGLMRDIEKLEEREGKVDEILEAENEMERTRNQAFEGAGEDERVGMRNIENALRDSLEDEVEMLHVIRHKIELGHKVLQDIKARLDREEGDVATVDDIEEKMLEGEEKITEILQEISHKSDLNLHVDAGDAKKNIANMSRANLSEDAEYLLNKVSDTH